jgi:hypothetical protein
MRSPCCLCVRMCIHPTIVTRQRLCKHIPVETNTHATSRRIVRCVVFYAVRVIWKESKRLVLDKVRFSSVLKTNAEMVPKFPVAMQPSRLRSPIHVKATKIIFSTLIEISNSRTLCFLWPWHFSRPRVGLWDRCVVYVSTFQIWISWPIFGTRYEGFVNCRICLIS